MTLPSAFLSTSGRASVLAYWSALISMTPSRRSIASASSLRARASVAARSLQPFTVLRTPGRTWYVM
ncbi:MAG: hypothetical protein NT049_09125 [Planctomycetota bacterium]|nr:hypothetical protein [Planctomycetota bacterium]